MATLTPTVDEPLAAWRERATAALVESRARLEALLAPVPEPVLVRQHSELMSPAVWDLAHIANYEEQWLVRALGAAPVTDGRLDALYDAFRHPRRTRSALPLLDLAGARAYAAQVRSAALARLRALTEDDVRRGGPLLASGFVYGMVAQHEHQHVETLLAALQLVTDVALPLPGGDAGRTRGAQGEEPSAAHVTPMEEVRIPAGPFEMGTDAPWAYDNERPRHTVTLPAFAMDRGPVRNADWVRFVEDGGYARPELWTEDGWAHARAAGLEAPLFWRRAGRGWERRRFGVWEPLPDAEPVCHVCWYEADAFARWAGKRLPTEAEWEKAARWDPDGATRTWPWGEAPPDAARATLWPAEHPAAVGTRPAGASACGIEQLMGDVWEWTSSDFGPYPGFRAFPYREYSEVFFGSEHKVLRGGAWTVAPLAVRSTFRNWDYPIRRQIFAGVRCCRDV